MAIPTYAQIEDTIQAAVAAGTGIAGNQVRWANQTEPNQLSNTSTYATLNVTSMELGPPSWSQVVGVTNLTQSATSELYLELDIQIFNHTATGINCAMARLAHLANYFQLQTTIDTLNLSYISLYPGVAQHIPVSYQTKYLDRAVMRITVTSLITTSSTAPWINDVQGDLTVTHVDGTHNHYPI